MIEDKELFSELQAQLRSPVATKGAIAAWVAAGESPSLGEEESSAKSATGPE